jgi:hypothetical protein
VINTQYFVATELQNTANGVTDNGGSQVPYVHLLGDIRRGEVDENLLLLAVRALDPGCEDIGDRADERVSRELDVDKSVGLRWL